MTAVEHERESGRETIQEGTLGRAGRTLRHGLTLANVDVTRVVRTSIDKRIQFGTFLLMAGGATLLLGYLSSLFADSGGIESLAQGTSLSPVAIGRSGVALLWLLATAMVVVRFVGVRGDLDNDVGILSRVPTREAVLGLVLSEVVLLLSWVTLPAVGIGVGYAVGGGTPVFVATLPLAMVLVAVGSVGLGVPVGLGVRHVATRIEFVVRYRSAIAVLGFVTYIALVATNTLGSVFATLFDPLSRVPIGWVADLSLAGTVPGTDPLRAAAVVPLVVAVATAGFVAATAVARRHWFADPVLTGETESTTERDTESGLFARAERALAGVVGQGTAAVAALAWRRAVRSPLKLLYVAYPLLGGIGFIGDIVRTGQVPAVAPPVALLFVTWAGAVVFTLNPLGDQGSALPATVLSRLGGRRFVLAHVLAGAVVAAPVGAVVVAGVGALSPLSTTVALGLAAVTPVAVLLAALFAVGVGTVFPRYDAVNITRSTEAVVPSLVAFAVFTAYLLGTATGATLSYEPALQAPVAGLLSFLLPFGLSVSAETIGLLAGGLVAVGVLAPLVSVRYAVRRFDRITVN